MKTPEEIEEMANQKLAAAKCLLNDKYYDEAFYVAGYHIELLLKAKICRTLRIDDFFGESNPSMGFLKKDGFVLKAFKVHDFQQLIVLSGVFKAFQTELANNTFKTDWSIVRSWGEQCRYTFGIGSTDAKDFVTLVEQLGEWIRKQS